MKETTELLDFLGETFAISIRELADGAQWQDAIALLPQLLKAGPAFAGLEGLKAEAIAALPQQIEDVFARQVTRLVGVGVDVMVANAVVAGLKGAYYTYAAIERGKVVPAALELPDTADVA